MTYRRTALRRLINAVESLRIRLGRAPRHRHLLTVPGRRSGRVRTTPVAVVDHRDGNAWLVAPYGEVGWVRNARAANRVVLARGRRSAVWLLEPAPAEEAAAVLEEYLRLEPITAPFFAAGPGAGIAALRAEADRHPVFRLRPA